MERNKMGLDIKEKETASMTKNEYSILTERGRE